MPKETDRTASAATASPHVHKWEPGGTVTEPYTLFSPVSANDHHHGMRTYQVMVCACGKVRRVLVGES
jgi:hypothetical protein